MRSPGSRMDILSQDEIDSINRDSDLVDKYNQTIDRESAFEVLTKKVDTIREEAEDEAKRKEWEKGRSREWGRTPSGAPAPRRTAVSPVVKVLTSATFIRGVLGIMKKVMK